MQYRLHAHRHADVLVRSRGFSREWNELLLVLNSISDRDLVEIHRKEYAKQKSISKAVNHLIDERLSHISGWKRQAVIFTASEELDVGWKLDFAKKGLSVEVGFNHGEAAAWNLIKPLFASEVSHLAKEVDAEIGVVVAATEDLRLNGGFDGTVGTFEKYVSYLEAFRPLLTVPMMIVGLEAPRSFKVRHQMSNGKKRARFVMLS